MIKKTKIICTIGPASEDYGTLSHMVDAGMNTARLNFSHGSHKEKDEKINRIRRISKKTGLPIAIIADLQGPKLRLGELPGKLTLKNGDDAIFSVDPKEGEIPIQYDLSPYMKKGQRMFLDDGLVEVRVTSVKGKSIITEVINTGDLTSNKGINIPDTDIEDQALTKKDITDAEFALKRKVDYLALSFVQSAKDLERLKVLINKHHPGTKIIAKIERKKAIDNLEEIVEASDVIMVARGDLALETSAAEVPVLQQRIVALTRKKQTPVIVATHMLESMIHDPRPTRAEASDVANAVINQVDAVMLSAESAIGKYPVRAVKIMSDIIQTVEHSPTYERFVNVAWEDIPEEELQSNAITASAASLAYRLHFSLIAVATASGKTAQIISSFRPDSHIVAITHDKNTQNQLALIWGIIPLIVKPTKSADAFWKKIVITIRKHKLADKGEQIVLVSGSTLIGVSGATDTIKVVKI